jgi:glycosyltransferase involved in cell wall biosynthesis
LKLLLYTHVFHPDVGGSETAALLLAEGFWERGYEVIVVTKTPAGKVPREFPFKVLRQPSFVELFAAVRWADAVIHSNISLRCVVPVWMFGKKWFVIHHSQIARPDGTISIRDHLKRRLTRHAVNLAVSEAMIRSLGVPCEVMFNPYDESVFRLHPEAPRDRDLVFLGRLVPDKGVDVLLRSLAQLRANGFTPSLTIIGDGPEKENLRKLAASLGVANQVVFDGLVQGEPLARRLNEHRVMVVPSMLEEPFGLVSVEGIACGCVVAGSRVGGLPEAIGYCGVTFAKGNVDEMSSIIHRLLSDDALRKKYRAEVPAHLKRFTRAAVVDSYLAVIEKNVAPSHAARPPA